MVIKNFAVEKRLDNEKINMINDFLMTNDRECARKKEKLCSFLIKLFKIFTILLLIAFFTLFLVLKNDTSSLYFLALCIILFLIYILLSIKQDRGSKIINIIFEYDKYLYVCEEMKGIEIKRVETDDTGFKVLYKSPHDEYIKSKLIYNKNLIHYKDDISSPIILLDVCQENIGTDSTPYVKFSIVFPLSMM